jgi:hypothetical protein
MTKFLFSKDFFVFHTKQSDALRSALAFREIFVGW